MANNDFKVIPAIDVRNGKCVRLTQGDYNKEKVYSSDPVEIAKHWVKMGAKRLHLIDLDGAKEGRPTNMNVFHEIRFNVDCELEIGGGIRSILVVDKYLEMGIDYIILGSIAFTEKDYFLELVRAYPDKIILGLDIKDEKIRIKGWLEDAGVKLFDAIELYKELPLAAMIITDISRDGMLGGCNYNLYKSLIDISPFPIIASGGISSNEEIMKLKELGVNGVIVGKALYEGIDINIT